MMIDVIMYLYVCNLLFLFFVAP